MTVTELSDDVRALFDTPNYAHIATVLPNGGPHSVPVWVGLEGNRIAFLTSPGSRKARNLDRDPRVAISITDHDRPYAMAQVRGRISERLEGDAAWAVIDRLSHKYTGQPYPLRTGRAARSGLGRRCPLPRWQVAKRGVADGRPGSRRELAGEGSPWGR